MRMICFFFFLFCLYGCNKIDKEQEEKHRLKRYENLILNTAFSCSHCDMNFYVSRFPNAFNEIKEHIIYPRKTIFDDSLSIEMAIHGWVNMGGDFPKQILYINNGEDFDYAFSFDDEYYYNDYKQIYKRDTCNRKITLKNLSFQKHLNYVLNHFDSSGLNTRKNVNRFVTLVCDSLLEMMEYSTGDTAIFRKEVESLLAEWAPYNKECGLKVKERVNRMVLSASKGNVRYFSPVTGEYAFWKLEIVYVQNKLRLLASMENLECYSVILM